MNIYILLLNTYLPPLFLSVNAASGVLLTLFLFLLCFLLVHLLVLLKIGWKAQERREKPSQKTEEQEKKPPEPKKTDREPIYYIVERKRTRPKQNYGEPKEFRFK